ncbi:MAG: D-threo-aldose 1-dehydrogenase [Pseudonocardiales bacterium]|jgi:D-threo-aldose 1-dehydrogenase|nr:aldo/keto reductase [Pseudonocardiales bacterium]MDT4960335.1 D-threo-aldose 1-dehydrogenase [Pseudonocardiales bacterium]MDT4973423.1 D-threo-aldose 1-dehydrogenase [Pseudonocardiales bacterium]MDT4982880.1 D-threo-aldose 1-dehydrogenase [Pseudonocardiales bacterium]
MSLPGRRVGTTNVHVTDLGFGCAPIGNLYSEVDDATAFDAVDAAWDAGIRYFDTAPHYGLGLSERRLGRALAGRPRDEYVLSTKVGRLLVPNPNPTGSDLGVGLFAVADTVTRRFDFSGDGIRRSLDSSLERLGVDRVDIVLIHDPDDHLDQAIDEAAPALVELREQGVISAVGVGMNQWQAPLRMIEECDLDVVMLAGRWTLADRTGAPLMDACQSRGISVFAAAPYNSGLLASDWPPDGANFDYGPAPRDMVELARQCARTAARHGATLPQLAMQFPLRHAATASVVAGMRTPQHVRSTVERAGARLSPELWAAVEAEALTRA